MSVKQWRIGIIGVGAIAEMHARAIAGIDNAIVVAGVCRTEEKGRKFATDFGCDWFDTVEYMLDGARPDAVTICTPSGAHLDAALASVERGVHVLCEKPLEITAERCDRMIAAADEAGVTLGGIFPQRFNPVVQAVQQAAAGGRFGPVATANAYVPWWRDDTYYAPHRWQGTVAMDGGGAMINQSIHAIDAMQWIAASAGCGGVDEVFAFTAKRGHDPELLEVEDTAVAALRFENGALGVILGSTAMWPGAVQRIHIAGRNGTAEVHEEQLITWKFRDESPDDAATLARFSGESKSGGGAGDPMAIDYDNHTRNIADFLHAIERGEKPLIDGREARKAVAIVRAVYEAAEKGKVVTVG